MDSIVKEKLMVQATPGSRNVPCVDLAIILAIKEEVIVELNHNDKIYTINPFKIRMTISNTSTKLKRKE